MLVDFSGTLMHAETVRQWVTAVLGTAERSIPADQLDHWAVRLEAVGALPGGPSPPVVPTALQAYWDARDLDMPAHRAAYTGLARLAGWPWPELMDALYERTLQPAAWSPYPDSARTLAALRAAGVRTAVLSNNGWDVRPVLAGHGLQVDDVVISYEQGRCKPDPGLFALACRRLGADPADTLMVGDNPVADRGGESLGIRTFLVEPVPVEQRPTGFSAAVAAALTGYRETDRPVPPDESPARPVPPVEIPARPVPPAG